MVTHQCQEYVISHVWCQNKFQEFLFCHFCSLIVKMCEKKFQEGTVLINCFSKALILCSAFYWKLTSGWWWDVNMCLLDKTFTSSDKQQKAKLLAREILSSCLPKIPFTLQRSMLSREIICCLENATNHNVWVQQ